jgi:hypothetical protein
MSAIMNTRRVLTLLLSLCLAGSLAACSDDSAGGQGGGSTENNTTGGTDGGATGDDGGGGGGVDGGGGGGADGGPGGGGDASASDATLDIPDTPFVVDENGQVLCGDTVCACANGEDDDGDGLVDGLDPECTGPYDDDEATFATGIPGDNKGAAKQDCFFDGNSGSGNDGCSYPTGCLTGDIDPTDARCQVSDECTEFCQRYAPNGCDCFGCCEIFRPDGTSKNVQIGNECSTDRLDDETVCAPCTKSLACDNGCGECELCLGKTVDQLPDTCFMTPDTPDAGMDSDAGTTPDGGGADPDGGPGADSGTPVIPLPNTCEDGETPCNFDNPCMGADLYCLQGCCIEIFQ